MATTSSTSIASATTLINPLDIKGLKKIESGRINVGHYVPIPTVSEIWRRYQWAKGWYLPRDILIDQFARMTNMENPFGTDKDGREVAGYQLPDGETMFSVESFPFDTYTQLLSMSESKWPYANVQPSSKRQTEKQLSEYGKFIQAILDMRMLQSNLIEDAVASLAVTGWLVKSYFYDPTLKAQDEFPYYIRVENPVQCYPMLDARGKAIWVTIEQWQTGAQLLQNHAIFPGVAEMILDEPDDATLPEGIREQRQQADKSFLTTRFKTIRYYDDHYTALLISGETIDDFAANLNPTLKRMKNGKVSSVLVGSKYSNDPYCGVLEHHYGHVPMSFTWCWPELNKFGRYENTILAGRFIGLPFLFSQYQHWVDLSRLNSVVQDIAVQSSQPKIITDSQTTDFNGSVIRLEEGRDGKYFGPPPLADSVISAMTQLQSKVSRGTFSPAASGMESGTSGIQQNASADAGSVRLDKIFAEDERSNAQVLRGITHIMIERGDEELHVVGTGRGRGGSPYAMDYQLPLDTVPFISVSNKAKNGAADPTKMAIAVSAKKTGLMTDVDIWQDILEYPDGKQKVEEMRTQAAMMESNALQPYVDKAAAQATLDTLDDTEKLKWQIEQKQTDLQRLYAMKSIEEKLKDLPADVIEQKAQQTLQQIVQQVMSQGQPPNPGLSMMPPTPPDGMQSGMPMPQGAAPSPTSPQLPPQLSQMSPPDMAGPTGLTPPSSPDQIAKAPGQADQNITPLSRLQPGGGVGRPGVDSILAGPQGLPGQPGAMPAIQAANQATQPIAPLPEPTISVATSRNRKPRRGRRG